MHHGPPDHPTSQPEENVDAAETTDAVLAELDHEPRPWWRYPALGLLVGLITCGYVSNVVWAKWITEHPAGLLALSARARYLLLVVNNDIDPLPYYAIGFVRLALAATVCYACGWAFRATVLKWFVMYLGVKKDGLRQLQAGFSTASWVLVPFFVGSNLICAFAGIERLSPKRFFPLLGLGIAGRLVLYWFFADTLKTPLDWVTKFSSQRTGPIMVISLILTVVFISLNVRRGKREWGEGL